MKYDEKYPEIDDQGWQEPSTGVQPGIIFANCQSPDCQSEHVCSYCNAKSKWIDPTLKRYFCSEECRAITWDFNVELFAVINFNFHTVV